MEVTAASAVLIPSEIVTLDYLKTKGGDPVRVRCEAINEITILESLKALPGQRPPRPGQDDVPIDELTSKAEQVALILERGTPMILAGSFLLDDEGKAVAAFYASEPPPHPNCIPVRMLRSDDLFKLVESIARLSGFLGGEAEANTFRGERDGDGASVGVVEGEQGHG